jgi:hypothetical protein
LEIKVAVEYNGDPSKVMEGKKLYINDGKGDPVKARILFKTQKPTLPDGTEWDQTHDAARNMRYAHSLNLPVLQQKMLPNPGRAIIVGGGPSVKSHLEEIRTFASNKENIVFAINWTHTWLIENGIIPNACVFFEIDAEPDTVLKKAHKDCTYYICSHCDPRTFDALEGFKRVLWHSPPNSDIEREVGEELFPNSQICGGGIGSFTRTLTVALYLGYRNFELFGCDSSYPDEAKSSHVDGYETVMNPDTDGFYVYAEDEKKQEVRRFKTLGYLALQVEEFKDYCLTNHHIFSLRVHGKTLLRFVHERMFPDQYEYVGKFEDL